MRALAALLVGAAALACRNGRTGGRGEAMPSAGPGALVGRITVTIPAEQAGADPEGRRGFLGTLRCSLAMGGRWLACDLPPLEGTRARRVAIADLRARPAAVRVVVGELPEGGAPVAVQGDRVQAPDGSDIPVAGEPDLGPREYVKASWHAPAAAPAPLFRLAAIRGAGRWSLRAYDGGRPRWQTGAAALPGEPAGLGIAADGSIALLPLVGSNSTPAFELIALDAATATPRWRTPLDARPVGPVLTSASAVAVLTRDSTRCQSCLKLIVLSATDGRVTGDVVLPPSSNAEAAVSAGLTGQTVWFYRYAEAHQTSELAPAGRTRVAAACGYEVYDGSGTAPARTLAEAGGEWRRIAAGCEVRAMAPLVDGHVAAIRVTGESSLEVVEFTAPP